MQGCHGSFYSCNDEIDNISRKLFSLYVTQAVALQELAARLHMPNPLFCQIMTNTQILDHEAFIISELAMFVNRGLVLSDSIWYIKTHLLPLVPKHTLLDMLPQWCKLIFAADCACHESVWWMSSPWSTRISSWRIRPLVAVCASFVLSFECSRLSDSRDDWAWVRCICVRHITCGGNIRCACVDRYPYKISFTQATRSLFALASCLSNWTSVMPLFCTCLHSLSHSHVMLSSMMKINPSMRDWPRSCCNVLISDTTHLVSSTSILLVELRFRSMGWRSLATSGLCTCMCTRWPSCTLVMSRPWKKTSPLTSFKYVFGFVVFEEGLLSTVYFAVYCQRKLCGGHILLHLWIPRRARVCVDRIMCAVCVICGCCVFTFSSLCFYPIC